MSNGKSEKPRIITMRPRMPGHVQLFVSLSIIILAFFILLNAFASYDEVRVKKALDSIELQFIGILEKTRMLFQLFDTASTDIQVAEGPQLIPGEDALFKVLLQFYQETETTGDQISKYGQGGQLGTVVTNRGLVITIGEELSFTPGGIELSDVGREFLDRLIRIIRPYRNEILIEGHTDDLIPVTGIGMNNWELSQARAMAVLRYIVSRQIDVNRLSAAGAGQWRPIVENISDDNRSLNRRVEIILKHPRLRERNY